MNKIFKKVWNRKRGCFVAVSEAMSSAAQSSGKATVITAGLVLGLVSTPSYAIYKHIYPASPHRYYSKRKSFTSFMAQ